MMWSSVVFMYTVLPFTCASMVGKFAEAAPSLELSLAASQQPWPEVSSDIGDLDVARENEESVIICALRAY